MDLIAVIIVFGLIIVAVGLLFAGGLLTFACVMELTHDPLDAGAGIVGLIFGLLLLGTSAIGFWLAWTVGGQYVW